MSTWAAPSITPGKPSEQPRDQLPDQLPEQSPEPAFVRPPAALPRGSRSGREDRLPLTLLCGSVLLLTCLRGATHPFWFDEVATAHIAGAPTWSAMLARSRLVDLHPPLEVTLVRLGFRLFGPHEFAGHLPSVLALTVAVGCLFVFLRRRTGTAFALGGALLPLCNADVFSYVTEARPYGLLFGAVCAGVLAYDTILRGHRPLVARLALALCLTAMLQAQLFGVFAAAAFAAAEIVRSLRLRRLDGLTWLALLLPWLSCLTYIPLLRIQAAGGGSPMIYEVANRTSLRKGLLFFHQTLYLPVAPLLKVMAVALLCIRFFPPRRFASSFRLAPELTTLLLSLLAAPVLITVLLHVRAPGSGFFPRYAISAAVPAFLFLAGLIAWRAGDDPKVAFVFLSGVLVGCGFSLAEIPQAVHTVAHNGWLGAPPGLEKTGGVERLCPELPLVMNDPLEFLEADFRLGRATETRMVYPSDPAASLRLEHENATQAVDGMARAFGTPHHVVPAAPFLAAHRDFVLLTRPRHTAWLTDALAETHARLQPLGLYKFAGSNADLWLVTQPGAGPFPATPTCPAH